MDLNDADFFEIDDRVIHFTKCTRGLSNSVFQYTVSFRDVMQDEGYVIIASKVFLAEEDEGVVETMMYHLSLAESENVYLTESPVLFLSEEEALYEVSHELISATGTSEYLSSFIGEVENLDYL